MRSPQFISRLHRANRLHHASRLHLALRHAPRALLVQWLQHMRSLLLVPKLHLALRHARRALLRRKPLEVRHNLVSSELPVT